MSRRAYRQLALEAARLLADGSESEYLHAKERAMMMLGLSETSRWPSNRRIKEMMGQITAAELGADEVARRVREMREIALQIMTVIEEHDPFLIGSTLSGKVRSGSDIDFHAYADDFEEIKEKLLEFGYEDVEEEIIVNRKGEFVHLKWYEGPYPVEITVYPWSWRDIEPISSVTQKVMKRANIGRVRMLLQR
jgi:predicted nucleotidyltransferase